MSIYSGDELFGDEVTSGPVEDERDWWQEFKDDRAMGRIDADGNAIEPEPPEEWLYQADDPSDGGQLATEAPF